MASTDLWTFAPGCFSGFISELFTDLVCILQLLFADCNTYYLLNKPGRKNNFLFVFLSLVTIVMALGNWEGLNEVSRSELIKSPAGFPINFCCGRTSTVCDILFQYCWALLSIRNGVDTLFHLLFPAVGCQSCGQQWNEGTAYWVCSFISGLTHLSFSLCLETGVLPFPLHPCCILHFDCFPGFLQSTTAGTWSV